MKKPFEFLQPTPEALTSEHLKEGIKPIVACVGIPGQFRENPGAEGKVLNSSNRELSGARNVDYYGDPEKLKGLEFKNAGRFSYTISTVDSLDKFSEGFKDCTGVVAIGQDNKTGKKYIFS